MELCHIQGNYCQMDSDLGGIIRYPAEEFEFFAYLSEMDESVRKLSALLAKGNSPLAQEGAILSNLERGFWLES